jgi:hypothetical protein
MEDTREGVDLRSAFSTGVTGARRLAGPLGQPQPRALKHGAFFCLLDYYLRKAPVHHAPVTTRVLLPSAIVYILCLGLV